MHDTEMLFHAAKHLREAALTLEGMIEKDALPEGLPHDVRRLVIAARNVAYTPLEGHDPDFRVKLCELDFASEAFASRVPWEDEPKQKCAVDEPEFPEAVERAFGELWGSTLIAFPTKEILQRLYNRAKDEVFHAGNKRPPTEAARTFGEYGMSVREVSQEEFNNLENLSVKRADERAYREGVEDGRQMAEKEREFRSQCFGEPNRRTSVGRHMDALRRTVEGDGEGLGR